jgi:hypothetical protein
VHAVWDLDHPFIYVQQGYRYVATSKRVSGMQDKMISCMQQRHACDTYVGDGGECMDPEEVRPRLVWMLKFNKHCSIFILFDKKLPILD